MLLYHAQISKERVKDLEAQHAQASSARKVSNNVEDFQHEYQSLVCPKHSKNCFIYIRINISTIFLKKQSVAEAAAVEKKRSYDEQLIQLVLSPRDCEFLGLGGIRYFFR